MAFSLVHFYEKLVLYNKSGSKLFSMISTDRAPNDGLIEFSYNFASQNSPESSDVTIHGLTRKTSKLFQKGCAVGIWAGWQSDNRQANNISHIFTRHISTLAPITNSGGDWQLQFTCSDGQPFDKEQSLGKIKSKGTRSNASGRTSGLDKSEISKISKAFKIKRSKIEALAKKYKGNLASDRNLIAKLRKKTQLSRSKLVKYFENLTHGNVKKFEQKHSKLMKHYKALHSEEMKKYQREEASIKGKRTPAARALRKKYESAHKAAISKIQKERTDAEKSLQKSRNSSRKSIQSRRNSARQKLQRQTKSLSKRDKRITNKSKSYNARKRKRTRRLSKNERQAKTRARGRANRSKKSKANKKSKSKKQTQKGLHFKKNTVASKIIQSLAKKAGIHINEMKLAKDKKYTSGYTADKKPIQCIQDIVNDCGSKIWFPHGKIVISKYSKGLPTGFVLTPETGLTQTPQEQDTDSEDSKSNQPPTFEVSATFLPQMTTGTTFKIVDPAESVRRIEKNDTGNKVSSGTDNEEQLNRGDLFNDTVTVLSGTLEVSGGDYTSDLTVERTSDVKKGHIAQVKSKQAKLQKAKKAKKAKSDKAKRTKTKKARKARQTKRLKSKSSKRSKRSKSTKHSTKRSGSKKSRPKKGKSKSKKSKKPSIDKKIAKVAKSKIGKRIIKSVV